ncbi:CHASE2 domain protein [Leptospira borgpetersenii serovar Pomona str. 200901868]|uniref:CHASE2 domain protein n=1 Tax=Leptospira borgpetersenii serovar Pomona str. 200901868 TaxID=1192866 RepID=M6W624_LEPBO|nr:CHASE2 domain protein [Leptospira borgpetersenii serovar Pomona str. 200901868]
MVKYILLCISIISCNYYTDTKLEEVSNQKEKIVLIDIDAESDKYMGERKKFRDNLIRLVNKIRSLRPSVIYLNNSFIDSKGGEEAFAAELNRNIATISAFELNDSGREVNFTKEIKDQIGKTIKGRFYGKIDNYGFTGINFPSIEIIKKSKAICSSKYYINDSNEVEFVYSLNRYKNYEFENCPFTVANEYLISYGLKIALDKIEGKIALYSMNNGKIKK